MKNKILSDILKEIAFFLELDGQNIFKAKSFEKAGKAIKDLTDSVDDLIGTGEINKVKGIGKGIIQVIEEALTEEIPEILKKYRQKYPQSLYQLLKIPGLGLKKIKKLYFDYQIDSIETMLEAINKNTLSQIPGFGEKLQERIMNGIKYIKDCTHFHLFDDALDEAYELFEMFSECSRETTLSGDLRRNSELVGSIDLIVIPSNILKVKKLLKEKFTPVVKMIGGKKQMTFVTKNQFNVKIHITNELSFPYLLLKTTGSDSHYEQLLELAEQKGFKLDEFGMSDGDKAIKAESEEDIYRNLGIPQFIPPELREGWGEIEYALKNNLPELIEERDIKGIFHIHSNFSDGAHSLEQLAEKAIQHGFEYIGISDHSKSAHYAGGLTEERVIEQRNEIKHLNQKYEKKLKIFFGIESDIRDDGSLDYDNDILSLFDFIIASIHSNFTMTETEMTERIIKAASNPYTTFLGHPTGRLLTQRPGYKVNVPKIITACAKYGTGIEINSNPYRLDISWRFLQYAKTKKIPIYICPDAHHRDAFEYFRIGVGIARKGMLEKKNVMNTMDVIEMEKHLKQLKEKKKK